MKQEKRQEIILYAVMRSGYVSIDSLAEELGRDERVLVFGEDVARKGGVYGVTRGLRKTFGGTRVFDTLLDEQSILGTALGAGLAGLLPIPEIQYLAYLHNAADQLRGDVGRHLRPRHLAVHRESQRHGGVEVRLGGSGDARAHEDREAPAEVDQQPTPVVAEGVAQGHVRHDPAAQQGERRRSH